MHVLQNSKQECAMHQGKKALVYLSYSLKLLSDSLFIACDCLSKTINGILWFSMEWGSTYGAPMGDALLLTITPLDESPSLTLCRP